jgi:hypothetical protein
MKSDRVLLATWIADLVDTYVDIPWPKVQQQMGTDEPIAWLNRQDHTQAQMILEKHPDGVTKSLYAEFYNRGLRQEFALRFAK